MKGRFATALARMHCIGARRLADSVGRYLEPGKPPVEGLQLQVDRNLVRTGPDGLFRSGQVGITWLKRDLPTVALRVGVFEVDGQRLLIEDIDDDDGHMITAACMVTP